MDPTSDFQQKLVEYLKSVHSGEFMTGSMDEVKAKVLNVKENKDYKILSKPCQNHLQICVQSLIVKMNYV
jgi:hypothetical protein